MSLSERIRQGVEAAPLVIDEVAKLEAERDRLLVALKGLLDTLAMPSDTTHPAIRAARAAIDAVERPAAGDAP